MSGKLGADAFGYYVNLGDERSYSAVADHFGVSKRAVVKAASREGWQERLEAIERDAREIADHKMTGTLAEVRARHEKLLRAMSARVAKALNEFPLTSGWEAMRGAEMLIKLERLIYGEPGDRHVLSVEQVTRREIESLVAVDGEDEEEGDDW